MTKGLPWHSHRISAAGHSILATCPCIESATRTDQRAQRTWGRQEAFYLSPLRNNSSHVEVEAMPTYAYRCEQCRETFERIETIPEHETAKPQCPKCGSDKVARVPTPFTAVTGKKS